MKREMYDKLLAWKQRENKKPLIIYGARQVGTTYLINTFGKDNYDYVYYINFEFDVNAKKLFEGNLDIKRFCFSYLLTMRVCRLFREKR